MSKKVDQPEPDWSAPIRSYAAMADHIEAGHVLTATITENSADAPQTAVTRKERVIEVEQEKGAWGGVRVRTDSGWHDVGETGSIGPRVPFTDTQYYRLFKKVVVHWPEGVADQQRKIDEMVAYNPLFRRYRDE